MFSAGANQAMQQAQAGAPPGSSVTSAPGLLGNLANVAAASATKKPQAQPQAQPQTLLGAVGDSAKKTLLGQ